MATASRGPLVAPTDAGPLRPRPALFALAIGAVLWETASRLFQFPFQPSLVSILQATWRMILSGEIPSNLSGSLRVLATGYGLAVAVGVPIGLVLGRYASLAALVDPYANALLAAPNLLLVPLIFGVFGTGTDTETVVVFMNSFTVVATMTQSGLATVSREYEEMARAFGASEPQIFTRILLPSALPTIMGGVRLGLGHAVRALIGAEMLIGSMGVGTLIRHYGYRFDAASVYGVLVVLMALALLANYAVHFADRRLNRWAN